MARDLAASQRQRIAAQHQPDGSAFAPRKQKAQPVTGRAACFLPRRRQRPAAPHHEEHMGHGPLDDRLRHRGRRHPHLRVRQSGSMAPGPARIPQPHQRPFAPPGNLRRKAMFRKLASARYLKAHRRPGLLGGLLGQSLPDRQHPPERPARQTSLRTRAIEYPRRELLGTTPTDREHLLDLLYEQLAEA
jgi:hypothetical protein